MKAISLFSGVGSRARIRAIETACFVPVGITSGYEMKPYYEAAGVVLYLGDCIEVMRGLPEASVDAIVTDPPYELGFMGKAWDGSGIAYSVTMWREALRVLKPGGHLAAFGGTRTYHRMAVAIEDAGFEVRDSLMWLYGSGFPKSLDVSKAIDKAAGAELHRHRPRTALHRDRPAPHHAPPPTRSRDQAIYTGAPSRRPAMSVSALPHQETKGT